MDNRVFFGVARASASTFDLVLAPLFEPTTGEQGLLADTELFWGSFIPGYQPGFEIESPTVELGGYDIDSPSGVLANPTSWT